MGGGTDRSKEWQMELMMEKLRSKAGQFKSLTEMAKNVRMSLLEKRYPLDSAEKNQHQKCLDTLQHSIKVSSLQSMVERLESLTRQLGLKFMVGPSGVDLFISSEMFYLEVILDANGSVRDVKVHHEGKVEQQSCVELVQCLSRGDFADFTVQLEGLSSIYAINAEKKMKMKAFSALQALENDLSTLAQLQTFIKEPFNLLHKSPVGILEKRRGGHPMKLTYFVSPYDLIDEEKRTSEGLSVETVTNKNLGCWVTVCMEGSSSHKLQTSSIISVNRNLNGNSTPSYATLSNQNSATLPACFVLKLKKPMPMCAGLARRIQGVTDLECGDGSSTHPLMSLIIQEASSGQLDCSNNRGLFVTLPDQHHCYFMTESKSMEGLLISSIAFSHPGHVPQILVHLRQQALFNAVIASCVRPCSKQDIETAVMFEVSALSWQHISISLEHPLEESMATAELDLSDISNVTCKIYGPSSQEAADDASQLATRVFQRCLSIPVTMRSVLRLWEEQARSARSDRLVPGNGNFSLPLGAADPGGGGNGGGLLGNDVDGDSAKTQHEPSGGGDSLIGAFPGAESLLQMDGWVADRARRSRKRKKRDGADESYSSSDSPQDSPPLRGDDRRSPEGGNESVAPTLLLEQGLVPPSVSITPISSSSSSSSQQQQQQSSGLERRPGIEIIPIASASGSSNSGGGQQLPSSITITPIASGTVPSTGGTGQERRKSGNGSGGKNRSDRGDKKRKRRRDEPPMGPPSVSVTIKAGEPKAHSSPKHSPKQQSSPGSGKPSMSALKSASGSPQQSGQYGSSSPKLKSSSSGSSVAKTTKQLDLSAGDSSVSIDGLPSPSGLDLSKGAALAQAQARNRKGSLSSVIDKLTAAQCKLPTAQTADGKTSSEYMVKPSSDGIKITINKTRAKQSSSMTCKPSLGSPKTHTGLKPGVNSGPASKKPQPISTQKSPASAAAAAYLKSKLAKGIKPKAGDTRKDRPRPPKLDPSPSKPEQAPLVMEGIIKSLDTNFQIPKLSARANQNKANNSALPLKPVEQPPAEVILAPAPAPPEDSKVDDSSASAKEAAEMLLDFSANSVAKTVPPPQPPLPPPPPYPASPSVSVHIVKSPAPTPSPLVNPSPRSRSPCITDDELMDEALVGLRPEKI